MDNSSSLTEDDIYKVFRDTSMAYPKYQIIGANSLNPIRRRIDNFSKYIKSLEKRIEDLENTLKSHKDNI